MGAIVGTLLGWDPDKQDLMDIVGRYRQEVNDNKTVRTPIQKVTKEMLDLRNKDDSTSGSRAKEIFYKERNRDAALEGLTISAITGFVLGVLALYRPVLIQRALTTQVVLVGALFALGGIAAGGATGSVAYRRRVFMLSITLAVLPVLFGTLGALNIIPGQNMIWATTSICGSVLAISGGYWATALCCNC